MTSASSSATCASHSSRVAASRFSRSSGSVFDGRRLNHHDPWSTVKPVEVVLREAHHLRPHRREDGADVGDLGVDLAALRVALERLAQDRQLLAGPAQLAEHQHRGDQAAVGAVVAGEVVVRRVLAAEDRAGVRHHLLDERVPDLRADRHPAVLADDLGHGTRADQVVQHGGARRGPQDGGGEDRGRRRAGQPDAVLVDDEHPVGVAVEGQPDVEPAGAHPRLQVALVGRLQRIGRVVRERPVELAVHHLELDRPGCARTRPARRGPPIPLAVSATTRIGRIAVGSTNERTWSTNAGSRSCSRRDAGTGGIGGAVTVEHRAGHRLDLAEPVDAHRTGARRGRT